MKTKVIEFFQNLPEAKHEQFNKAFELYRQSEGKNPITERNFNVSGYTPSSLDNLLYDLQKMHGITDVEKVKVVEIKKLDTRSEEEKELDKWKSLDPEIVVLFQDLLDIPVDQVNAWAIVRNIQFDDIKKLLELSINTGIVSVSDVLTACIASTEPTSVSTEATDISTEPIAINTESSFDDLIDSTAFAADSLKNQIGFGVDFGMLKEENETLKSENEELQSDKEDLEFEKEELEEENEGLKAEVKTLKLAPKLDAKQIRVEFPFLNDKDCPDEMKILMADKITAWNHYLELQSDIQKSEAGENTLDKEQLAVIAKEAIALFDENQKIYDELNAYQTTGKILGLHPLFKKLQLTREVETMTSDELVKYKASSAKYFTDNRKSLAKAEAKKDEARILEIKTRVEEREQKLALVNKKLGIPVK